MTLDNSNLSGSGNPTINTQTPSPEQKYRDPALLTQDSNYQNLLVEYQKANWENCKSLLSNLLQNFPENPKLRELQLDVDLQSRLHELNTLEEQAIKNKKRARTFRLLAILVLIFVILSGAVFLFIKQKAEQAALASQQLQAEKLKIMDQQAQGLLQIGKPDDAMSIIQEIQSIDPNYAGLDNLNKEAVQFAVIEKIYQQAMDDIRSNNNADALGLLLQIQKQAPTYRDVSYQITQIQKDQAREQLVTAAQQAYSAGNWKDAINAYEKLLDLDSYSVTNDMKSQLMTSYLKAINDILNNPNAQISDIDLAEGYFRKGMALFPQSTQYADLRDSLQKSGGNLLKLRYMGLAKSTLEDPNLSISGIDQYIQFLTKASGLDPKDDQLKKELDKAKLLQSAVTHYVNQEWPSAISSLNNLASLDANYDNGIVNVLLYESNYARGSQYLALGFYQDASLNFQAAENIAFNQTANKLETYQVEVSLGYTLGEMNNYKDAASYFKYALNYISIYKQLTTHKEFLPLLQKADADFNLKKYQEAYTIYADTIKQMQAAGFPLSSQDVQAKSSGILVFIAAANNSTVQAIQLKNNLSDSLVVRQDGTLSIPSFK